MSANYTFYIYPEYGKKVDRNGVPKIYLYFQDYLLLNDAIYIRRYNSQSLVYFQVRFKNELFINDFSIKDNSGNKTNDCENLTCYELNCNCTFYLGYKSEPEILTIEYISKTTSSIIQKRNIFLILYETSILQCYIKSNVGDLEITTYSNEEMEYDQFLYFNDTAKKALTIDSRTSNEKMKVNNYIAKLSSLNSGTFAIFSFIPDLNNIINSS